MRKHSISIHVAFGAALLLGACGGGGDDGNLDPDSGAADAQADAATNFDPCKRVDLVFAVDASYTMREELAALSTAVFPAMADRLIDVGNGLDDYRVAVMDGCPAPATFHTRGAMVEDCAFESGQAWMDSNSSDLIGEFGCVADMYVDDYGPDIPGTCTKDNDDEQPANAAATALLAPFIDNENAGFLRDDALLVVVAMTDEDENAIPPGGDSTMRLTPEEIYNKLISIKGGVDRMVFLGIGGATACTAEQGEYGAAKEATRLKAVTDMFIAQERGVFWDLCTGKLEEGLGRAMGVIEATCNIVN